jgi:transposase
MEWVAQCPDDLVGPGHPVRVVMAVVEKMELSDFHEPIKSRDGQADRNATDPQLLVAIWLYACIRGIGSARELTRRCEDSAAFRWLCGGVTVNHRLLSDFSTDHGWALAGLFTHVIASLVDKEVVHARSCLSMDASGRGGSCSTGRRMGIRCTWRFLIRRPTVSVWPARVRSSRPLATSQTFLNG